MLSKKQKISSDPALVTNRIIVTYIVLVVLALFGLFVLKFYTMLGTVWLVVSGVALLWVSYSEKVRFLRKSRNIVMTSNAIVVDGKHSIGLERIVSIQSFLHLRNLSSFRINLRSDDQRYGKTLYFVVLDSVLQNRFGGVATFVQKLTSVINERKEVVDNIENERLEKL